MPGSTSRYHINYPVQTDPTNVPGDIETPMDEIDAILTGTFAGALASRPAFGIMGRRYYANDTGNIYFDTGSTWLNEGPINTSAGNIQTLTPGGAVAVGSTGFSADAGHKHPLPGWGAQSDYQAASTTAFAGSTGRFADAGHVHPGDPAGIIKMFGGTAVPSGYVLCNGASYLTATYPSLFAAIGYTWGGSGANFTVPNLVDRSPVGANNIFSVGQLSGATQVTLTAGMLAAHSHSISDPQHSHTSPGGIQFAVGLTGSGPYMIGNSFAGPNFITFAGSTSPASTGISGTNLSSSPSQAVPLYHPVSGVNFIIRAY